MAVAASIACAGTLFAASVYVASEWRLRRTHDAPLESLAPGPTDLAAGRHMAELVGCWAGCHGREGGGGTVTIKDWVQITAPALAQALPAYSDEQLVRLIRYGVKRDGTSAIGMSSYTFWTLGGEDLRNIVAFVRAQPAAPVMQRRLDLPFRARLALARGKWKVSADEVDRRIPRWGDLPRRSIFERGRYLASVVCAECHGTDFRGNPVQGGPSLAVVAAYGPAEFQRLLRTGLAIGGRAIPDMSWMAQVHFDEGEISDLYGFLREYHHR